MALRLVSLLASRAGSLAISRAPALATARLHFSPRPRHPLRFSTSRRLAATTTTDFCDSLACTLEAQASDSSSHDHSGQAMLEPPSPKEIGTGSSWKAEAILIKALEANPPATPGDLLDRIAESQALASSGYVNAIIKAMCERPDALLTESSKAVANNCRVAFKSHLLNKEVCVQLMIAIHRTNSCKPDQRVHSRILVGLYNTAQYRGWDVSPSTLASTGMYLANSSLFAMSKCVRHVSQMSQMRAEDDASSVPLLWSYPFFGLAMFEISFDMLWKQAKEVLSTKHLKVIESYLREDPVDTALDIAQRLIALEYKFDPLFAMTLLRALCARERREEAEWLFAYLQDRKELKNLGKECSLMMSLYYRIEKPGAAEAIFGRFRDACRIERHALSSTFVVSGGASERAKHWSSDHSTDSTKATPLELKELQKLRHHASAPFYRKSLELIRTGRIDDAMKQLREARYTELVTNHMEQFSNIIHEMVVHGFVSQAYTIHTEFRISQNTDSQAPVSASTILFEEITHHLALSSMVTELAKRGDWDCVWRAIDSQPSRMCIQPHISSTRKLLELALATGNAQHAVRCVSMINRIGLRDKRIVLHTPESWIDSTLADALKLGASSEPGHLHPFADIALSLLYTEVTAGDSVYAKWNASVISQTLAALSLALEFNPADVHSKLYSAILDHNLTKSFEMCAVLQNEAIKVLNSIPESLLTLPGAGDDVSGGWKSYVPVGYDSISCIAGVSMERGVYLGPNSAFWECTVRSFACKTDVLDSRDAARYLLLTLKLAHIGGAKIALPALTAANVVLHKARCPLIDVTTGDVSQTFDQVEPLADHSLPSSGDCGSLLAQLSAQPLLGGDTMGSSQTVSIKPTSSTKEKLCWYNNCRLNSTLPGPLQLSWLVKELIIKGEHPLWEHIVGNDMPLIMAALETRGDSGRKQQLVYASNVWSQAVSGYAKRGMPEEMANYYCRIIQFGGCPTSLASSDMLAALFSTNASLPVILPPAGGDCTKIFGIEPAYPPQGESLADKFLAPASAAQRANQVADIGLFMLYSMFQHGSWPLTYFYSVLFSALGRAKRIDELRHIFESVMPASLRSMPARLRINPLLIPTPDLWTMAIKEAISCGHQALAKVWFTEYRMSALPLFREAGSPYSRFACKDQTTYGRLYRLSAPYYTVPRLARLPPKDGSLPSPWYDLEQVEMQLELDRLRAMDKLPLYFFGATKMLQIYTTVDEHRDMSAAEDIAAEIMALDSDSKLPSGSRPKGPDDLAFCWRLMVSSYNDQLTKQQQMPEIDEVAVKQTKERLAHWFKLWESAISLIRPDTSNRKYLRARLDPEKVKFIRSRLEFEH